MAVVDIQCGAVTPSSAWVRGKVDGTTVRLVLSTSEDLSDPTHIDADGPNAAGVASARASGLTADTRYWYAFEVDSVVDTDHKGTFRTFPPVGEPASFTFVAASCAIHDGNAFDRIRELSPTPLFWVHLGDLHYEDIHANESYEIDDWRQAYDDVFAFPKQAALHRAVPWVYVWDDHDGGTGNDSGNAEHFPIVAEAYRERIASYDLDDDIAVYQSWQVGRVLFVLLDCRARKTASPATMLGSRQKAWLLNLLTTSNAEALVVLMQGVWIAKADSPGLLHDTWYGRTPERNELAAAFRRYGWAKRMCMIGGDVHALAIDHGEHNEWGGWPVYIFAPFVGTGLNDRGGPWTTGMRQADNGDGGGDRGDQWGLMEVVDDGDSITITGKAMLRGEVWAQHSFNVRRQRPRLELPSDGPAKRYLVL